MFIAIFFTSLSVWIRSNGIFTVIILGFKIIQHLLINIQIMKTLIKTIMFGTISFIVVVTPYFLI